MNEEREPTTVETPDDSVDREIARKTRRSLLTDRKSVV